jgi:hypothetical protein
MPKTIKVDDLKTREEIVQELVEMVDLKRRLPFLMAEKIIELIHNDNDVGTAKGTAAEVMACSRRYVDQLTAIFDAFGWESYYPDVPWSLYRACMATDNPHYWLGKAMAGDWSVRQLKVEYKKETGQPIDEEAAATKFALKAEGEVNISPGLITIKSDDVTLDNFEQGKNYHIDIRP